VPFSDHLSTMASGIQVHCPDPAVKQHLGSWLEEGRIVPPIPLRIEVRVQEPTLPPEDLLPVFRQPGLSFRRLPPDDTLSITWDSAPAVAEVRPGDPCARVILSPKAVEMLEESTRTFFLSVLIFLLRRAGWHHVHGGTAVDRKGRGWLFAGDSRSGKSTTAALVCSRGWAVGTDDIAFLAPAGERVEVRAFRSRIALRAGGRDLMAQAGGVPLPARDKVGFWPDELGGSWVPTVAPEIVIFTTVGGDRTRAVPLGPGETLSHLVRWSAWVVVEPGLADEHLGLLTRLGRQSRAYQVSLGRDLFGHPDLLSELIP
jgi:hypothetical protein